MDKWRYVAGICIAALLWAVPIVSQAADEPEEITGDEYIWLKADEFSKSWLSERGYKILETRIFDDCIGYRCSRNNFLYTIYMFAYGKEEKVRLDGEFCKKLLEPELSQNSCVLVMCLNVLRFRTGDKIEYRVWDYAGHEDSEPELWRVAEASGKPILEYFPRKEIIDAAFRLMYAFNRDDLDAYDCIQIPRGHTITGRSMEAS